MLTLTVPDIEILPIAWVHSYGHKVRAKLYTFLKPNNVVVFDYVHQCYFVKVKVIHKGIFF